MLTESKLSTHPVALFFFAHQDDEYGVFQSIQDEIKQGREVLCCYFTDGGFGGASVQRRNKESISVLTKLGVLPENILFFGEQLSIGDGKLAENCNTAVNWLLSWLPQFNSIQSIYVTAWEGGHHDHDALHAIIVAMANRLGLLHITRQFSLYNAYQCRGPLFRVKVPLNDNGPTTYSKIPWPARMRYLRYCMSYPSQAKTWIGLFPFVFLHYAFDGRQATQPISVSRLQDRPHEGALYYEKRQFYTWEKMIAVIRTLQIDTNGEHTISDRE